MYDAYRKIAKSEMYRDPIRVCWYIDILFSAVYDEGILFTSFIGRFSLFSTNAMH